MIARVSGNRLRIAVLLMAWSFAATAAHAAPEWYTAVDQLRSAFDFKEPLSRMEGDLAYFRMVFTALGSGAVMIGAIRKVAKARTGEESMGWVASTVMTIALMATGPALGGELFKACDDVAKESHYKNTEAVTTCWNALLVILPGETPAQEVMEQPKSVKPPGPTQKQDATWTKLAWTWMKMAWTTMTDALGAIGAAFNGVVVRFFVILLLFLPSVVLVCGIVLIQLGEVLREFLHLTMDVFLPMMIAMLSFAPMRGAATNFLVKYISIAFWPVAWALGNAIACSVLLSVMRWVVSSCEQVMLKAKLITEIHHAEVGIASAGYLAGAAALLPWGYLFIIVGAITLTCLLIHVSAIGAPAALTALMTKGTAFASAQLSQAAAAAATVTGAAAMGGAALAAAPAAGATILSSTMSSMTSVAARASSSLGGAASRLAPLAAAGGPAGFLASVGKLALGSAAHAMSSMASAGSSESSIPEPVPVAREPGPRTASILDASSRAAAAQGGSSTISSAPLARPLPRHFRRSANVIDI